MISKQYHLSKSSVDAARHSRYIRLPIATSHPRRTTESMAQSRACGSDDDGAPRPSSPPLNPRNKLIQAADVDLIVGRHVPGCRISDVDVYRRALTHPSYCMNRASSRVTEPGCVPLQAESYERLEFLGDAVLNLVVAGYLFERYPHENEGFMTRMRTKLVNGVTLADLCGRCTRLPEFVMLSKQLDGDTDDGATTRMSNKKMLEDTFEAFLGALHVERGFDAARQWLIGFLEENVDFAQLVSHQNNAKNVLNRYFMTKHGGVLPKYEDVPASTTRGSGKGAAQGVASRIRDRQGAVIAIGFGANRREAEDAAAKSALQYFGVSISQSI